MRKGIEGQNPRLGTVNFERRKHPRFSVDLPVEYWQVNGPPKSHSGRVFDVSEGGLLFYISDEIAIGQNLKIRLFFDSGQGLKSIEANVQVIWKDFLMEEGGLYRVGLKFLDISPEDLQKLKSFLINLMKVKNNSDETIPSRLLSALGISGVGDTAYLDPKAPDQD